MNIPKKIIAVFSCIAIIISCLVFPVSASGGVSGAVQTFLEWSVKSGEDVVNGFWKVIYGDDWRSADREQLQSAYTTYVTDLETDLGSTTLIDGGVRVYFPYTSISDNNWGVSFDNLAPFGSTRVTGLGNVSRDNSIVTFQFDQIVVPFSCYVTTGYVGSATGVISLYGGSFYSNTSISSGVKISATNTLSFGFKFSAGMQSWDFYTYADLIPVTGASLPTTQDITINSRPTSITGDYGIIGDNGTIVKVDGNIIVDESTSTVYNPVTNTTNNYTSWAYDYSDRSYNLTLESGDTMTVTYGDEYVTINEGDTTYNVYYLVENEPEGGGGGSGGSGSGDTHTHTYTDEITKQPTCLLSGVRTYTCSCGDSYTKTVPATGHDWQITQQVPNTYDPETGEQTQTGYTVYTCATCGEQYKSTDGQAPPNGNSSGGSSIGLGDILSGLLGVLGEILGALVGFFLTLVTKALEALSGMLDFFIQFFEIIPTFFGSFIDFLAAMFPFLPEETITILNFGLILLIAAAIFRKFLK